MNQAADAAPSRGVPYEVKVHGQLSTLITPATPRSLAATEFPPSNSRGWLTYALVGFLILMAVVGLIGYIVTLPALQPSAPPPRPAANPSADSSTTSGLPCLGAAFNGLFTAYRYLRDRSFDHGYVAIYVIRFVLGVLSGMLLANLGTGLFEGNTTIAKLGPGMIALLGGYSAEAVRQILDRLVEVLVTVVRGKDDAAAAERLKIFKDVLAISQTAASDPNTPRTIRDQLQALLRKLRQ